jgi:S1-C subfamily serine protease
MKLLHVIFLVASVAALAGVAHAQSSLPPRKDIPAIAKAANNVIVSIVMLDKDGNAVAQGSGFLVSKDGRIVTNYHVVKSGSSAIVKLPDGAFYRVEGMLAFNKDRDVAIIKARGQDFRAATLGDSDRVQVGESVVAIGNPLSLESTVSNGIVSGIRNIEEEGGKFLQITAPISPGSSGGPLFNMAGEVVGITTLYIKGGENLNFAIPINDVKPLLSAKYTEVLEFPDEAEPSPPSKAATSVQVALWKNLKDGEIYKTRVLHEHLYLEKTSTGIGVVDDCDFVPANSIGISWIGTCWKRDPTTERTRSSSEYLTLVTSERIEGSLFILVPSE